MQYLMIENPGVCPVEGVTVLGVSMTRDNGDERTIGQFGSGSKHAINLLLRNDILPIVFCGNLRLEFYTDNRRVKDRTFAQVCVRISGKDDNGKTVKRSQDLGFVLEYGGYDWDFLGMALREFVSNALDASILETSSYAGAVVECKDEAQVRAKAGFTRIFVPLTPDVQRFYRELGKRFLHFSEPENLQKKILSKNGRNVTEGRRTACIYKKGVLVREVTSDLPSLFDYNFGDELRLDESRNVEDYTVRAAAAQALSMASANTLRQVFSSLIEGEKTWEEAFDRYHLRCDYNLSDEQKKERKGNWERGWKAAAGDKVMCRPDAHIVGVVARKGFGTATVASDSWRNTADELELVRTDSRVMTGVESRGMEMLPATVDAQRALDWAWGWVDTCGMTTGKPKPEVKCFNKIVDAESTMYGFVIPGESTIYLNVDIANGQSAMLKQTVMEELAHYVTGATDMSRDFQEFLLKMLVSVLS